ncbi:copper amine oxidase N-terminal domain-containing protein [Brevibacillus sp. TJ4]|uniref:copper amine oxidase N-terminal domain-containing protein n=1 Tax=Brevibacillus sp. TJ4 TaxID=3234853 RepID=UPI003B9E8AC6
MNWSKKVLYALLLSLALSLSFEGGVASACSRIAMPFSPVLTEVGFAENGNLSAWVKVDAGFTKHMDLVITDSRGEQIKQIPVKSITKAKLVTEYVPAFGGGEFAVEVRTGAITIAAKEFRDIPDDKYLVSLVVRDFDPSETAKGGLSIEPPCGRITLESDAVSLYITGGESEKDDLVFPGGISIDEDGDIEITINITAAYAKAKFYLVIYNEEEKEVKRITINTKNPRISSSSLNLPAGKYEVRLEVTNEGQTAHTKSVRWVIGEPDSTGTVVIPSGAEFPGGITVNTNGTITIVLQSQEWLTQYNVFLVATDHYGKEVQRIKLNLAKPQISIAELKLLTGSYSVYIEIVDKQGRVAAHSLPAVFTVNLTNQIAVFIDGQLQVYPKNPIEIDGRTLVPLRAIFESLGARVEWDEATQTVTAYKDGNVIQLTIGSKIAYKNGERIVLDVPAQLLNGDTTLVPVRFVSEALGAKVQWDPYSRSVVITQ